MKMSSNVLLFKLAAVGMLCTFWIIGTAFAFRTEVKDTLPAITVASASNAETNLPDAMEEKEYWEEKETDEIELENDLILATDSDAWQGEEKIENDLISATPSDALSDDIDLENNPATASNAVPIKNIGAAITLPEPTRKGYHFVEWNTDPEGFGDAYQAGDSLQITDMRLYAIWEQDISE